MTSASRFLICVGLIFVPGGLLAQAQVIKSPIGSPVDHPVLAASPVVTAGAWRKGLERFGESLVSENLRLRGYQVENLKLPGNHGIDLIAAKRAADGRLLDVRLVEVKTHYGSGMPHLGETLAGRQMSRTWLSARLRALRASGSEGKALALEISRFYKASGIPIERLGELHDVNLRWMKYVVRDPITLRECAGPVSIPRFLKKIASQPGAARAWAMRHLAVADQLQRARMERWLSGTPTARAFDRVVAGRLVMVQEEQALRGVRRLVRFTGRAAIVIAVAMDSYEIYGHIRDYRLGKLSQREFVVALARSGGGIAGAWAGASGGAWAGGWIGGLGGPVAWVTVPVGAIIGGAAGGIGGYFGGSYLGQSAARAWYAGLDRRVREQTSTWMKHAGSPFIQ
jgi:hypothetical protein